MKRIQISTIAIALSALFTGQAIAQDSAPLTRTQVQAEMVEAINTGHVMVTESGRLANDVFSSNYPQQENVSSKTREEVRKELVEAIANGSLDKHISA